MTQGAGGITLDRYLDKKGVLDPTVAARVVLQIAAQLAREMSPAAVTPARVVVLAGGRIELRPATGQQVVVDAPEYASPEEVRGEAPDARSALYSLGCTFYELLVGEPPFVDEDPDTVLRRHLESPVPDPRKHVSGIPAEITAVIRDLLAKERDFRIQTAQQLAVRLRGIVQSTPQATRSRPVPGGASRSRRPAVAASKGRHSGGAPPRKLPSRSRSRAPLRALDDDGAAGRFAPKVIGRKMYPFTIAGACIGVVLGFVFALNIVKSQRTVPAREKEHREAQLERKRAQALASRKKEFLERFEQQDQGIAARIHGVRNLENPVDIRDSLLQGLTNFNDGAAGPTAAKRLVAIWDEAQRGTRRISLSEAEAGFREHREAANKLYADGKLGEAIKRIRRAEREFQVTHGKEIDAFIERLSQELEDKWEADQARAKELARAGEPEAAIELMRKAMEYGDPPIRKEAEKTVQKIQAQTLVSSRTGEAGGGASRQPEAGNDEEGDDSGEPLEDDLEAEFEDFIE